jgi:hypothetical protein
MDGFSGAASGTAVVSLTIQIAESISKLRDFFESIKMAPKAITLVVKDLRELSSILDSIQVEISVFSDVITTCLHKIENLHAITDELEPGFRSSDRRIRQWTSFKAVRKDEVLKRFKTTLEETKTTLILALQAKNLSLR